MQTAKTLEIPERLRVVATLARLLTALDHARQPVDAHQYRGVVQRLSEALSVTEPDEALDMVLTCFPSAGEVYENLRYAQAGLCRQALDASLEAEMQARDVLARASR